MSKELRSIVNHLAQLATPLDEVVLATVVDVQGSSYRLPGARMLIDGQNRTLGTVSGGCLETDVLERAARVRRHRAAEVFVYDTTVADDSVFALNMGCRGVIRILLEPAGEELAEFLRHRLQSRHGGATATLISAPAERQATIKLGARLLFDERGVVAGDFGEHARNLLAAECAAVIDEKQSRRQTYEFGEVFFEYLAPPVRLVVFGAGADAIPLVELALQLGWHVTVIDHRAAFANRERFPEVDELIVARPERVHEHLTVDGQSVAVVMTHNYEHDKKILRHLLVSDALYVGALGPKRRSENILRELHEEGSAWFAKYPPNLYGPIGLDIGADAPETIALAILAEINSVLTNRTGGFLRERHGSIYNR